MKTFRKTVLGAMFALLVLLSVQALAWTPPRGAGCAGILASVICSGTPVTITGQIVGVYPGQGYIIDTGQENVLVCGMGPIWYWNRLGVPKPRIGETITIEASEVTLQNGNSAIVAMKVITADGATVQLRDPETCYPLWFKRFRRK